LRDRRARRLGAVAAGDTHDLRNSGQAIRHKKGVAANRDQRHIAGFGLHAVDVVFQLAPGMSERDGWLQQDL
jgi:hypothetical protein